jgi:hypothetical protein
MSVEGAAGKTGAALHNRRAMLNKFCAAGVAKIAGTTHSMLLIYQ